MATQEKHPVYFMDLVVENVRCFGEQQTLDLSNGNDRPARWTVILGENGTGKTTLLRCLAALEPQKFESPENLLMGKILQGFHHTYSLERTQQNKSSLKVFKVYKGKFAFQEGIVREYKRGKGIKNDDFRGIQSYELPQAFYKDNFLVYAYGATRRMGSGSLSDTKNPDHAASLFSDDVSLINAEEWLLQADFAVKSSEGEVKEFALNRYEKVKKLLIDLLPDDEVQDIRTKPITKTQLKAQVEVKTSYGWVDMKDLSLGYQTLIAWMVDLAARLFDRYPDSGNPLAEPAIVLVDEIDLHLHPKWQRTLISRLTELFPQTQFIVTAHSPLIVQAAQDANVVLLEREGDQVKIYNNKDKDIVKGWRIDQLLTSDLFGLDSARPAEYDALLKRREELLSRPELTEVDKQELETIGKKLDELPVADKKEDDEAMDIIRKAAELLKSKYRP